MPRATLWLLSQLFCFDVSIIILLFLTNISLTVTNKAMSATLHPSFDQNTIPQCNVLRHSWVIFSSALHRLKPLTRTTRRRSCQARCVPICINPALNQVIDGLLKCHPSIVFLAFFPCFFGRSLGISPSLDVWNLYPSLPPLPKQLIYRACCCPFFVEISTIDVNCINICKTLPNLVKSLGG